MMDLKNIAALICAAVCCAAAAVTASAEDSAVHSVSHRSGIYSSSQAVRISAEEGAQVRYTTDGTIPSLSSTLYDGVPIVVNSNTVIFTAAFVDGNVVEFGGADIKIRTALPTASFDSGCYDDKIAVALTCPEDAEIYYTTDGSNPTAESYRYSRPLTLSKDCTLRFAAVAEGKIISKTVTREYTFSHAVYEDSLSQQLFELVNETRRRYGLCELEELAELSQIAQTRAEECSYYFSHWRPNGTKWDAMLYSCNLHRDVRAENIAYYYTTAQSVLDSWMNSYYHRANILNPEVRYIGIGRCNAGGCNYWTQIFIGEQ